MIGGNVAESVASNRTNGFPIHRNIGDTIPACRGNGKRLRLPPELTDDTPAGEILPPVPLTEAVME